MWAPLSCSASRTLGRSPVARNSPSTSPFVPVPNAYLARKLSEKAYVGFGFYAPYGLGISLLSCPKAPF